jgi:hypothetical protein
MAEVKQPLPVKYFIAVLFNDPHILINALRLIENEWGRIDCQYADHPFDVTDYYVPEMGENIVRRIITIEKLYSPTLIVDMKLRCNAIENELAHGNKRTINLDAGYLDHNKVLLASAKEAGQKVYLDKGIYADLSGRYKAGKYQPFEWSFPDFKDGRYDEELLSVRMRYMKQLKEWRHANPGI